MAVMASTAFAWWFKSSADERKAGSATTVEPKPPQDATTPAPGA
jgi:hypothetical protein